MERRASQWEALNMGTRAGVKQLSTRVAASYIHLGCIEGPADYRKNK